MKYLFLVLLFIVANVVIGQEKLIITKTTELGPANGVQDRKDTLIYEILKYSNGSYEKNIIYCNYDRTPFYILKKILLDSSNFYSSHEYLLGDSSKVFEQNFYGQKESNRILRNSDSSVIMNSVSTHRKGRFDKTKTFYWHDYRNDTLEMMKIVHNRYLFSLIEIKKWRHYNDLKGKFEVMDKDIKLFNFHLYYKKDRNEKMILRSLSKYKKSKLIKHVDKEFDSKETIYTYDQHGRILTESQYKYNDLIFRDNYSYTKE